MYYLCLFIILTNYEQFVFYARISIKNNDLIRRKPVGLPLFINPTTQNLLGLLIKLEKVLRKNTVAVSFFRNCTIHPYS